MQTFKSIADFFKSLRPNKRKAEDELDEAPPTKRAQLSRVFAPLRRGLTTVNKGTKTKGDVSIKEETHDKHTAAPSKKLKAEEVDDEQEVEALTEDTKVGGSPKRVRLTEDQGIAGSGGAVEASLPNIKEASVSQEQSNEESTEATSGDNTETRTPDNGQAGAVGNRVSEAGNSSEVADGDNNPTREGEAVVSNDAAAGEAKATDEDMEECCRRAREDPARYLRYARYQKGLGKGRIVGDFGHEHRAREVTRRRVQQRLATRAERPPDRMGVVRRGHGPYPPTNAQISFGLATIQWRIDNHYWVDEEHFDLLRSRQERKLQYYMEKLSASKRITLLTFRNWEMDQRRTATGSPASD